MARKLMTAALILTLALTAASCGAKNAGTSANRWMENDTVGTTARNADGDYAQRRTFDAMDDSRGPLSQGSYSADSKGRVRGYDDDKDGRHNTEDAARSTKNAAKDAADKAKDTGKDIADGMKDAARSIGDAAEDALDGMTGKNAGHRGNASQSADNQTAGNQAAGNQVSNADANQPPAR